MSRTAQPKSQAKPWVGAGQRGLSLLELMIATGIISVVLAGAAYLVLGTSTSSLRMERQSVLGEAQQILLSRIQADADFEATLKHPVNAAAFACLLTVKDCRNAGGEIQIFDRYQTPVIYSQTSANPTAGFSSTGGACNEFSATEERSCRFRYVASWLPVCPKSFDIQGGTSQETLCRNPMIEVTVQLQVSGLNGRTDGYNADLAKVSVRRPQVASDLKTLCQMMGNTLASDRLATANPDDIDCLRTNLNLYSCATACAASDGTILPGFVIGFRDDGTVKCECAPIKLSYNERSCNAPGRAGRVVRSVSPEGRVDCGDGIVVDLERTGAINNTPTPFPTPTPTPTPDPGPPIDPGGDGGSSL